MKNSTLYVLLENIRSAYNVGSIFRTCDAAHVETLFLTGYTPYPPHPKLNKTALGSLTSVHWEWDESPENSISILKRHKVYLIAMESDRQVPSIFNVNPPFPCCMIFGNEITGISKDMLSQCNEVLTIPQYGKKESLNVSVAAGIAIYEMRRKIVSNNY